MIQSFSDYSIKHLNTFGLDVTANKIISYTELSELQEIVKSGTLKKCPVLILGGGSNLLFADDYSGVILHSKIGGIELIEETSESVLIKAGAGVSWDELVEWSVIHNYSGIENLSHIPGSVGASPVQNIGAYGTELKDVFEKAEGIWIQDGQPFEADHKSCEFEYRYSIFKGSLKNRVILTSVFFRLSKKMNFRLDYGSVKDEVGKLGDVNLKNIRQAIVNIRSSKLPDPDEYGNAGSFFKNPVVPIFRFEELKKQFPEMPFYLLPSNEKIKIPAGWLIERLGWKGKRAGRAGVHEKQALVLVNLGGASGHEIIELAESIEDDIFKTFGIQLEREVNVVRNIL